MAWYMVFQTSDGRPVSQTTIEPPRLAAGLDYVEIAAQSDEAKQWDAATTALIARPAKVLVDRTDAIVTDYQVRGGRLNAPDEAALRATLAAEFEEDELIRNTR